MTAEAITLKLPIPPSLNVAYRNVIGRGRVKTKAYRDWQAEAQMLALLQSGNKSIAGPYAFHMLVERPDNRRRDLGNLEKLAHDLCVAMGLVEDDCLCQSIRLEWRDGPPVADATATIFLIATKERSGE